MNDLVSRLRNGLTIAAMAGIVGIIGISFPGCTKTVDPLTASAENTVPMPSIRGGHRAPFNAFTQGDIIPRYIYVKNANDGAKGVLDLILLYPICDEKYIDKHIAIIVPRENRLYVADRLNGEEAVGVFDLSELVSYGQTVRIPETEMTEDVGWEFPRGYIPNCEDLKQ